MKAKHVHKYQRAYLGPKKYVIFKCMLPGCSRFMSRTLVVGQVSICWKCGGELILDMENTSLRRPTHQNCRRTREAAA